MIHNIVMRPEPDRPGCYTPMLDGNDLSRATRTPLVLAARALLRDRGAIAGDLIRARHAASEVVAMSALVGEAARLRCSERSRDGLTSWQVPAGEELAGRLEGEFDGLPGLTVAVPESTGRKAA